MPKVGGDKWFTKTITRYLLNTRAVIISYPEFCSRFLILIRCTMHPAFIFGGKSKGKEGSAYKMTSNRISCYKLTQQCSVIRAAQSQTGSWERCDNFIPEEWSDWANSFVKPQKTLKLSTKATHVMSPQLLWRTTSQWQQTLFEVPEREQKAACFPWFLSARETYRHFTDSAGWKAKRKQRLPPANDFFIFGMTGFLCFGK